ncbi:DBP [Bat mastadenovirus WIV17]|uniref:DNA-binding protein n=1 Tax=Bat mastadenovirus WIV17 TaxID=1986505 RepID=A0A1X9RIU0_9ADEN|nr:DBP [Bat mastadenovirus WIV17]ARQ79758.1 DBP [Bat mastadenovirus WIV17]
MSAQNLAEMYASSGDEDYEHGVKPKTIPRRRLIIEDSDIEDSQLLIQPPKRPKINVPDPQMPILPSAEELGEVNWQQAMEKAVQMMTPLKVDIKNLTMLADAGTYECFKKLAQAWINDKKKHVTLSYTTNKTFASMIGRFLFGFVIKSCNLSTPKWNPTGCVGWKHGCTEGDGLKCLHGLPMVAKEQVIEMDVASENGQRAVNDNKNAKIINKWGKQIVQIKNSDARSCFYDSNTMCGMHCGQSCGVFYTEGTKAETAFKQMMAFQVACYPKMPDASKKILLPIKCDCNIASNAPMVGRQICKITPFGITMGSNIDISSVTDNRIKATVTNPALLVFQCCNPAGRNARANKNCDFKISAPDVMTALQLAKQIWVSYFNVPAPVVIPEFKWCKNYEFQTTVLPIGDDDDDECLF